MTRKILVVDDEVDIRTDISEDLQDIGWQVQEASNGVEALETLKTAQVDAVLSDIRMPKCGGFQLLQEIRANHGHRVPVVLMSAITELQFWDVYDAGADGYFGKPFLPSDLQDLLDRLSQPDELRWSKAVDPSEITNTLPQPGQTSLALGRGGIFLGTNAPGFRRGQKVSFDLTLDGSQLKGVGVIRWKRAHEDQNLESGLGVEFLYLTDDCRQAIVNKTKSLNPLPFIPKGARPQTR
jgi:CheY-like chemotaxis protein